jgi:hypothetical protein
MRDFDPELEKLKKFKRIRAEKSKRNYDLHEKNQKHKLMKGVIKQNDNLASNTTLDWRKYM